MNLSNRFAYRAKVNQFLVSQEDEILGQLTNQHKFRQLEQQQINSWRRQIRELKQTLAGFPDATLLLEFEIPRIGKRVDGILILNGSILVLEYKVTSLVLNGNRCTISKSKSTSQIPIASY